jgi:ABC-2 type transport system ATP-binding protein/ribosome-dependent ATPase
MNGSLMVARSLTRRFGSFTAVDGVDLSVEAGEVVGLLGANGAGKTTLIRMVLGLLHPSAGQVRLFGEPPSRRTRARIGYVPQGLGLYEDLTVAENLRFTATAFRAEVPRLDPDLDAVRDELVASLPLGLRRRLAFAAALGHRPELLVLDEPTSGVDALAGARLWDAIRSAAEGGTGPGSAGGQGTGGHGTGGDGGDAGNRPAGRAPRAGVLVSTHSMGEAEQCDRLVVMAGGKVVAGGTVDQIIGDATTVAVRGARWEDAYAACEAVGLPVALVGTELRVPAAEPDRVMGALRSVGVQARVEQTRATLEEAFVLLAGRTAA